MRRTSRILPLALLLVGASMAGPVPPATAATKDVAMSGSAFDPATVTIAQGTTVRWTNQDGVNHSSRSDQGFWDGPLISNGETYSQTAAFQNAGTYPYFCELHSHMTGRVKVRMKKSGSPGAGWTIRWSSLSSTPDNRTFDVQVKRPGSTSFEAFRTNTSARSAGFNPSREGTYVFRARTDNTTNNASSGFSPTMSVSIS